MTKRPSAGRRPAAGRRVAGRASSAACSRSSTSADGDRPTNSLVIARVVLVHVAEDMIDPETLHVDPDAIALVGRMGGDLYSTTRDRFMLRRPSLDEGRAGVPIEPVQLRRRRRP